MMTETHTVSGNTYEWRKNIRQHGLRWDAQTKTYRGTKEQVDALMAYVDRYANHGLVASSGHASRSNEPCRRCGSYCYGDCTAN